MGIKLKWKPGEVIGQGKFGQVLRCLNSTTGKLFVAKRIQINSQNSKELTKQMKSLEVHFNRTK